MIVLIKVDLIFEQGNHIVVNFLHKGKTLLKESF